MMELHELARVLNGRASGAATRFTGVSSDTRAIAAGDLFVALRGERFDAHEFLAQAGAAGAAAALVDSRFGGKYPLPVVVVEDTKRALGELARHWRRRFSPALIAVAGSNGKTTVKEMLASILRTHAGEEGVLYTKGNLNNEIGLPLTLLRMRAAHRFCAIELGMNHKGEIAGLAGIACPGVALVNNAQREHLEFMNSVEEVAAENAGVYEALPHGGVAVVNADDAHGDFFRQRAGKRRIVDFGIDSRDRPATVSATYALKALTSEIKIATPHGSAQAVLAIPGIHNVRNAVAAAACAFSVGIDTHAIARGLSAFRPYTGRLQVKQAASGATVIDDTYNANPDSVRAAIDVLASCAPPTVLVLGDMGEVGAKGPEFHREVGAYARSANVSSLLAIGDSTRFSVEAFGAAGYHAASIEDLLKVVRESAKPKTTLLVKGSRFMKMERVVAALTGAAQGGH